MSGKTVTVKVKYSDFTQATRSKTLGAPVAGASEMLEVAVSLLASVHPFKRGVRLLGVTLSSLNGNEEEARPQLELSF